MPTNADPNFQLEIDEWILDYLIYIAIKDILECYQSLRSKLDYNYDEEKSDLPLQLVVSYLTMFRVMHPGHPDSEGLRFRLRLLKFTVMFTKRANPTETTPPVLELLKLRDRRAEHAQAFRSKEEVSVKLDLPDLTEHLAPPDNMQIKKERSTQDATLFDPGFGAQRPPPPAISLLDTLPYFMALSAAHNATMDDARVTNVWMLLAAGYMAQAAMEQYLTYEAQRNEVLREAFAWGFDAECGAEPESDEWRINAMFWGDDEKIPGWDTIRDEHWQALIPPEGIKLQDHFWHLMANNLSITKFEESVMSFLGGLLDSQPRPLLAQLESGKIDGLSRKETRALQKRIGIV